MERILSREQLNDVKYRVQKQNENAKCTICFGC